MRNGANGTGEASDGRGSERAIVLHPFLRTAQVNGRTPEARLEEAVGLARAIDLDVVAAETVGLVRPRPATYIGAGSVEGWGEHIAGERIGVAVVDAPLSPGQQRNLERSWKCKVIDRTGLILEIFGARARTREGTLQVDLAHLTYQKSRLVRSWTHLERQRGGAGFMGGPGETQIEADRRQLDGRIKKLERELETVRRTRGLHREARRRIPCPVIALVGYTNAGKSTLFNRLTRAEVLAEDLLFATLDPTMRAVRLPSRRTAILSDTVGFVSDLPTELVAAFRATLEEVVAADVVVHVRDVSHPDAEAQRADVLSVLRGLGVDPEGARVVEALNKTDLLPPAQKAFFANRAERNDRSVPISALTGEGIDALLDLVDAMLNAHRRVVELAVPLADGARLAWLYRHGEVMCREDRDGIAHVRVGLDQADLARFEKTRTTVEI